MTIVDLTRELVSIPSHDSATRVGDVIEAWLSTETEATVTRDATGNVLATRGSGSRSLAFVGHHDVVPPDETQISGDDYLVEERDGRLYGRGTADMKGALAAMLHAFRDASLGGELQFASFVDEETGGAGARAAIANGFGPDYAIVGEGSTSYHQPGVTDVAIAHKGRRGSTVTAHGTAAHASEPASGDNAIYRSCEAIDWVRNLEVPQIELFDESLQGSLVVTEINGGSAWNVIPERCEFTIDERTIPGKSAELAAIETIEGIEWTVDQDLPPMRCHDESFIEAVRTAASKGQTEEAALVTKPHATDAGWLSEAGVSCVICGPAEPGEAHTTTESVGIDILEQCADIYRWCAERWPRASAQK